MSPFKGGLPQNQNVPGAGTVGARLRIPPGADAKAVRSPGRFLSMLPLTFSRFDFLISYLADFLMGFSVVICIVCMCTISRKSLTIPWICFSIFLSFFLFNSQ
jgi:hypothetical protein